MRRRFFRHAAFALCSLTLGAGSAAAQTLQDNVVQIDGVNGSAGAVSVSFAWDKGYAITANQPWGGVTTRASSDHRIVISAAAGRHESADPMPLFRSHAAAAVGGASALDKSGSVELPNNQGSQPHGLNFAFTGTLFINGTGYPVVIAQGHSGTNNNWWIGLKEWRSEKAYVHFDGDSHPGVVTADGRYIIVTSNWTGFQVRRYP